jgi:hypothetical protein
MIKPLIRYGLLSFDNKVIYWTWEQPGLPCRFITERIFILPKGFK